MANQNDTFEIIRQLKPNTIKVIGLSAHAKFERKERIRMMNDIFIKGSALCAFEVNTDHELGNQYHILYESGIVEVIGVSTHELITTFVHTEYGVKSYWKTRQKPRYYDFIAKVCKRNYETYKKFCKDADSKKAIR